VRAVPTQPSHEGGQSMVHLLLPEENPRRHCSKGSQGCVYDVQTARRQTMGGKWSC
jgi:hypothetical protein